MFTPPSHLKGLLVTQIYPQLEIIHMKMLLNISRNLFSDKMGGSLYNLGYYWGRKFLVYWNIQLYVNQIDHFHKVHRIKSNARNQIAIFNLKIIYLKIPNLKHIQDLLRHLFHIMIFLVYYHLLHLCIFHFQEDF